MSFVSLTGVGVRAGGRMIVENVDLALLEGRMFGLIGPNGAGKTTLMRLLARVLSPTAGRLRLDGNDLARIPRRRYARSVAYLAQETRARWPISVAALVGLGRLPFAGPFGGLGAADREHVDRALRRCDIVHLAERAVTTLSGGERARVHLARVLANAPRLLLADEPVAALDPRHQLQVMALLRTLAAEGATILVVMHDLTLAARFCHHLFLLDGGRLVAQGAPDSVLTPDRLAQVYQITALTGAHEGEPYVVPWHVAH